MTDRRSIALLLALHLAIVLVVQPRGDFPLNDDWAYAQSVQWLFSEGRVRLSDWISPNLLPQTLAGGAVTAVFGFSFENLRHITQLVAAFAGIAVYAWFRAVRLEPRDALVATVAVIAFPPWPVLANSYMTDLYGMLLAFPAAAFFLRALERPAIGPLVAATAFAVVGVLQRQVVMVLPLAFLLAWLWGNRRWTLRTIAIGAAPLAAVVVAQLAYQAYLTHGPGIPEAQQWQHGRLVPLLGKALRNEDRHGEFVILNALTLCAYMGLFSMGWMLWWGWAGMARRTRIAILAGGALTAAIALALVWVPPYRFNMVLDAAGIGPFTIFDGFAPRSPIDRTPGIFWRVAGVVAAFGGAALVALLWANLATLWRERRDAPRPRVFMLLTAGGYLFPFIAIDYIDRYILFLLPFLFALWALTWPSPASAAAPWTARRTVAIVWLVAVIGLSAVATRDYFSWNRARWAAIRAAEGIGATPDTLDGGFEYNAYHRHEIKPRGSPPGKSWWWVKDDRYIVAFAAVEGYEEIASYPVRRHLATTPPVVRLLRRR